MKNELEVAMDALKCLLKRANEKDPPFPSTLVFEEGWLLRLVLQWFSDHRSDADDHKLSFCPKSRWFSEARLASAFLKRGADKKPENHTHADGVIGHFEIKQKSELKLENDFRQFVVVEAKMYSGLSKGVTHAKDYDQVARTVACMAEVIKRAWIDPKSISRQKIIFLLLAPEEKLNSGVLGKQIKKGILKRSSIEKKVRERAICYDLDKQDWLDKWFLPIFGSIQICSCSWEDVIRHIKRKDRNFGDALDSFYFHCRKYAK